jgi:hypothetical protein
LRLHSTKYKRGDVLILNNNDDHYKCELWIITDACKELDHDFNYVGSIEPKDLWKLDLIDADTKFKLKIK